MTEEKRHNEAESKVRIRLARLLRDLRHGIREGHYIKPDLKYARQLEKYLGLRKDE